MIDKDLLEDFGELLNDYNPLEDCIAWRANRNEEYVLICKMVAKWIAKKLEIRIDVTFMFIR